MSFRILCNLQPPSLPCAKTHAPTASHHRRCAAFQLQAFANSSKLPRKTQVSVIPRKQSPPDDKVAENWIPVTASWATSSFRSLECLLFLALFPFMAFQPCPVVTQPAAVNSCCPSPYRDWKSGLTDCSSDQTICFCGIFCLPCLACKVGVEYGECFCVPFLPGALVAMRTGLREQLRIKGCVCCDWCAFCFCCPCALCQMARELKSPCC